MRAADRNADLRGRAAGDETGLCERILGRDDGVDPERP